MIYPPQTNLQYDRLITNNTQELERRWSYSNNTDPQKIELQIAYIKARIQEGSYGLDSHGIMCSWGLLRHLHQEIETERSEKRIWECECEDLEYKYKKLEEENEKLKEEIERLETEVHHLS